MSYHTGIVLAISCYNFSEISHVTVSYPHPYPCPCPCFLRYITINKALSQCLKIHYARFKKFSPCFRSLLLTFYNHFPCNTPYKDYRGQFFRRHDIRHKIHSSCSSLFFFHASIVGGGWIWTLNISIRNTKIANKNDILKESPGNYISSQPSYSTFLI